MDQQLPTFPTADHDLLIEVGANVKNMSATLTSYTSANSRTSQDHETRIRVLEADSQLLKGSQRTLKMLMSIVSVVAAVAAVIAAFIALR